MKISMLVTCGLTAILFFLLFTNTIAAPPPGPCYQERQTLCDDIPPGAGATIECLNSHQDKLSAACREHVQKMSALWKGFNEACKDDLQQYCPQVKPGQGRGIGCLKGNMNKISAECQQAITNLN